MKKLILNVSDMQSLHCQTNVRNAIKNIEGVQIEFVEAGKVSVIVEREQLEKELINTIQKAGYTVVTL